MAIVAAVFEDFQAVNGTGAASVRDIDDRDALAGSAQPAPERFAGYFARREKPPFVCPARDCFPAMIVKPRGRIRGEEGRPKRVDKNSVWIAYFRGGPGSEKPAEVRKLACLGHAAD